MFKCLEILGSQVIRCMIMFSLKRFRYFKCFDCVIKEECLTHNNKNIHVLFFFYLFSSFQRFFPLDVTFR